LYSVKTGQPAVDHAFGGLFDYLFANGEDGATFNAAMSDFSGLTSCAVLLAYNYSAIRSNCRCRWRTWKVHARHPGEDLLLQENFLMEADCFWALLGIVGGVAHVD
jgi:hypothetical protein